MARDGSREALRWAADQAACRGKPLHVVHVVHYPVGFGPTLYPTVNLELLAAQAENFAADVVGETLGRHPGRGLTVQGAVGSAGEVLSRLAEGADMLVIGVRGNTSLAGILLGSVSHHCVHHATCPVVVVPPSRTVNGASQVPA